MTIRKKRKSTSQIDVKIPDVNFIPYVCHYNPETILTKDGELMQIIRITGFHESVATEIMTLRESLRNSLLNNVNDNDFALWFTTIRRKKNIIPEGKFGGGFPKYVNEIWNKENSWESQYVNELYISVIIEGVDTSVTNFESLFRSITYRATRSFHNSKLEQALNKLSDLTSKILNDIQSYKAKLLTIKEWDGILYSEHLRFFGKIINLHEERYPLSYNDISHELSTHKIAFGDYDLEVVGKNNKNYAAMISIKEYSEIISSQLDMILQLPFEFIVTQSFDFIQHGKDLENYQYQDYILNVSNDNDLKLILDLDNIVEDKQGLATDYGELQTTIMIISDEKKELENDIVSLYERFNDLGIVAIRENIFTEHCYWSQLPGNFAFIRRQKTIDIHQIAGFAALYNFPAGTINENYWGPATAVLHTIINTPYFFSFHEKDEGHSMILGDASLQKSVLLNFLIIQSLRFKPKIFYFDFDQVAKCFINLIDGKYYKLSASNNEDEQDLKINIIKSLNNKDDAKYLGQFFYNLAILAKNDNIKKELANINNIVKKIYQSRADNLKSAIECFNCQETQNIYQHFLNIYEKAFGKIFDNNEEINWNDNIIAFDLTNIIKKKALLIPIIDYLLYKIEQQLDSNPAIVVFNEAWELLDNPIMSPKIDAMLTRFKEKNCVAIFSAFEGNKIAQSKMNKNIIGHFTSKIIYPDYDISDVEQIFYEQILHMSDQEIDMLHIMNKDEKQFLLKHGDDSVIINLDFTNNIEITQLLASDKKVRDIFAATYNKYSNLEKNEIIIKIFEALIEAENNRIEAAKEAKKQQRLAELRMFNEDD